MTLVAFRLSRACERERGIEKHDRRKRSACAASISLPLHRPMRPSRREIVAAHNLHDLESRMELESDPCTVPRPESKASRVKNRSRNQDGNRGLDRTGFGDQEWNRKQVKFRIEVEIKMGI
ncbi:hypothetical protein EVAR_30009_1 [Eumeta japonica]|uniref:Uncharacterized protein n=1 Tax=Eumeta variegata TaxID=151549 RepID=A0A4C1VT98_EUMVA|nr:hypothetical protein EVAR_30009_1 [Eumeta japonica]